MPRPIVVTIGTAAFFSAWCSSRRWLPTPLRPRGADVVLAQHLEHGGARHARDQRHVDEPAGERRQDQVPDERAEALGEAVEALHGQPAAA